MRPNCDILPVGTAIDIELVVQSFPSPPPDSPCRDKFQLLVAVAPPGVSAASFWSAAVDTATISQHKFRVTLDMDAYYAPDSDVSRGDDDDVVEVPVQGEDAEGEEDGDDYPGVLAELASAPAYEPRDGSEREPRAVDDGAAEIVRLRAEEEAAAGAVSAAAEEATREREAAAAAVAAAAEAKADADADAKAAAAAAASEAKVKAGADVADGGGFYATAAPDVEALDAAAMERVLAGRSAPQVTVARGSDADVQRAAVERAGQLWRLSQARDSEIAGLASRIAEANHRLADAKVAVLPAYDVKYAVDDGAGVPLVQVAIMAAISALVLTLLV